MARVDPRKVYDYLVQKGVSPGYAAGILANIEHESSFSTSAVGDNGTSGGLFQHHKGRWENLKAYAAQTNRSWTDWTAQVDFALQEARQMGLDMTKSDPVAASKEWTLKFERPANAAQKAVSRARSVSKYQFGGGSGSSAGEFAVSRGTARPDMGQGLVPMGTSPTAVTPQGEHVPTGMWQLPQFMEALRQIESGNNYGVTKGHRLGAYGISRENWEKWSRELGISGARWTSDAAQDFIARSKAAQFFERYGDWRLVAVAWWGGTLAADQAASEGLTSSEFAPDIARLSKAIGQPASAPVGRSLGEPQRGASRVSQLGETVDRLAAPQGGPSEAVARETQLTRARRAAGLTPTPGVQANIERSEMHRIFAPMLQGLSNAVRRGGAQAEVPLLTEDAQEIEQPEEAGQTQPYSGPR